MHSDRVRREMLRAGVITLSCDDFVDFMGGYFIELGMGLCEQVYFDPALVDIIDGAFYYWSELKQKTLKLLPKWIIGSSAEQAADKGPEEKTAKRDLEGAVAEGGETVEPILDAFGAYSTCAMFTVYNVRISVVSLSSLGPFGPRLDAGLRPPHPHRLPRGGPCQRPVLRRDSRPSDELIRTDAATPARPPTASCDGHESQHVNTPRRSR